MKYICVGWILCWGIFSCNSSADIYLPNKNININNQSLMFKEQPFTGKINVNFTDKIQGFQGFLNFNEGHLNGTTELKNDQNKQHIRFTIVNGKFDQEVIIQDPEQSINMKFIYKNGIITQMDAEAQDQIKYNLSFDNGLTNGSMEMDQQKLIFKDGVSKIPIPDGEIELKLLVDQQTGDMIVENIINGTPIGKQNIPNTMTVENLEKIIFDKVIQQ